MQNQGQSCSLSEFLIIHIWRKRRRKKHLLDHFSPCIVILLNVHPCIKHNNLFFYIYVITTITKCLHTFRWKILGLTWVDIDLLIESRDNGSFLLRILTTQKMILHVYKLGCLIVYVVKKIKHIRSHSTFFMYLMPLLWYAMKCFWSSQWICLHFNI